MKKQKIQDNFEVLRKVHKHPKFSQREMAQSLGFSLGKLNYCLKELQKKGFNIVIYANHLLRASYPSMVNVAKSILKNKRSKEADNMILSIKEILNLIPGTN